jgi:hypothetical protein
MSPLPCLPHPLQGYYDNRYWTMWKLPMFGCTDPSLVLQEVNRASKAFPQAYIRLVSILTIDSSSVPSMIRTVLQGCIVLGASVPAWAGMLVVEASYTWHTRPPTEGSFTA